MQHVLPIDMDSSLPAERVVRMLEQVVAWRGQPRAIRLDNGLEFLADRLAPADAAKYAAGRSRGLYTRIRIPMWNGPPSEYWANVDVSPENDGT